MENYIIEGKSMILIHGDKLKELGQATGKTGADLSREFGQGSGNFTQACSRGRINRAFARFLEKEYDIPIEAYAVKRKEPEAEPEEEETTEVVGADISEILNGVEAITAEIQEVKTRIEEMPKIPFPSGQDSALTLTKGELLNVIYKAVYSAVLHATDNHRSR